MDKDGGFRVGMSVDERLSASAKITPAQEIQADFSPQRSFIREPARATMARAKPKLATHPRAVNAEGRAANARFAFGVRQDDFYSFHAVSFLVADTR